MRILILSASYAPVLGGLQAAVHRLARGVVDQGHQVLVITNRYPRSLPTREVMDGIEVERLPFLWPSFYYVRRGRPELLLASFCLGPLTLARLASAAIKFRPDIVNVHFPDSCLPFLLPVQRALRLAVVSSLHGDEIERHIPAEGALWPSDGAHRRQLRAILRRSAGVTACSSYLLALAGQLDPSVLDKGSIIRNGVDLERFSAGAADSGGRPYILAYGRLVRQKGFDLLLEAFAHVAPKWGDVDLLIAGEGEERVSLESLASKLDIGERVRFLGRASGRQVAQLLGGCRLVAVPSRWEPLGIVALEALAAGKPVVATRVGGLPEILEGTDCELVEPTAQGLAGGLDAVLDSPEATSPLNRERAGQFTWTAAVEHYLEVFETARAGIQGPRYPGTAMSRCTSVDAPAGDS